MVIAGERPRVDPSPLSLSHSRLARSALATRRYQQCRRHLKPMFKQMRAGQMPSAVASSIVEIASHMIKREYVKAHDAYIT